MNTSRDSWTESNRQLWTSSPDAGLRGSETSSTLDDISANLSSLPSLLTPNASEDPVGDALRECRETGGGVLTSRTESSLTALLGNASIDVRTKNLLSLVLTTNARRRRDALEDHPEKTDTRLFQEKLRTMIGKIGELVCGENAERVADVEAGLLRLRADVEKCVRLAQVLTHGDQLNLQDALLEGCRNGGEMVRDKSESGTAQTASTARDLSELLESYGYASEDSRSIDVVSQVLQETERLKRETNFQSMLLRRYEATVKAAMSMYGELEPPTLEEEKLRLDLHSSQAIAVKSVWFGELLHKLGDHVSQMASVLVEEKPPVAVSVDISSPPASRESISNLLSAADWSIVALTREYRNAQKGLQSLASKMQESSLFADGDASLSSTTGLSISALADNLASAFAAAYDLPSGGGKLEARSGTGGFPSFDDAIVPPVKLLRLVVNSLPAGVRTRFSLDRTDKFNGKKASQLLSAILFLDEHNRDTTHRIDDLCKRLRATFHLKSGPNEKDRTLADQLVFLEDAVSAACQHSIEALSSESLLSSEVRQSIEEMAQLLTVAESSQQPLHKREAVRIASPTSSVLEMTRLLKSRLQEWLQSQAKRNSVSGQARAEKTRLEESVSEFLIAAQSILADILSTPDVSVVVDGKSVMEDMDERASDSSLSPLIPTATRSADSALSGTIDRLKMVKTRYARMVQSKGALKTRLDSTTQHCSATVKRTKKAIAVATAMCKTLGISIVNSVPESCVEAPKITESESQEKGIRGKLNLRLDNKERDVGSTSASQRGDAGGEAKEDNLVEMLEMVASRISTDETLVKRSLTEGEIERLQTVEKQWHSDTTAYRKAMAMILTRLAESGQMIKQSLFLLGTDESAKDDIIESVLYKRKGGGRGGEDAGSEDAAEDNQHESNERALATLLQKYARWSRRLVETTEDHLDTQQKLVKYFAAVRRYFTHRESTSDSGQPPSSPTASKEDVVDENLIDIDTTLMRIADAVLPAIDRAVRASSDNHDTVRTPQSAAMFGQPRNSLAANEPSAPSEKSNGDPGAGKQPSSPSQAEGLPYDHRLGRLYEMIGRLHTIMTSLLRVRYLSVPTGTRQRSSGESELVFDADDGVASSFVELDLEKLEQLTLSTGKNSDSGPERFSRESESTPAQTPSAVPTERVAANNDLIFRVSTQNLECVYQTVRKFSSSHKLAAIVVQKDTDAIQESTATMLEKYSELDIEQAFGQDRGVLRDIYAVLRERGPRQKGCYFFNRINGEGECAWVRAIQYLCDGFGALVDRLLERTERLAQSRELTSEVVDLCAMFVNWTEVTSLPAKWALPPDVVDNCVRDNEVERLREEGRRSSAAAEKKSGDLLPPLPLSPASGASSPVPADFAEASEGASGKVSGFRRDDVVVKVIASMFQLAQSAVEEDMKDNADDTLEQQQQQLLEEQLQMMKEAVAVAERRASQLEQEKQMTEREKEKAISEAAVARAELRRWKRLVDSKRAEMESSPAPMLLEASTPSPGGNTAQSIPALVAPSAAAGLATLPGLEAASAPAAPAAGQEYLHDLLHYMKALGEELRFANRAASAQPDAEYQGDEEQDADAREAAQYGRETQRHLQEQYSSTPLRVIAEPDGNGYASARRRARPQVREGGPTPMRRGATQHGTPLADRRRYASRSRGTSEPPFTAQDRAHSRGRRAVLPVGAASVDASAGGQVRSRASGEYVQRQYPTAPVYHSTPRERASTPVGMLADAQDLFFDVEPATTQRSYPWMQEDKRPRRRYTSPATHVARGTPLRAMPVRDSTSDRRRVDDGWRLPAGGLAAAQPPQFMDALGRIQEAEEELAAQAPPMATTRHRSTSNVNVRNSILRRLGEVVSKTQVCAPTGDMF